MHHHNKKQGLSKNEKVLFTDKKNRLFLRVREAVLYGENKSSPPTKKQKLLKKAAGKKPALKLL